MQGLAIHSEDRTKPINYIPLIDVQTLLTGSTSAL